MNTDQVQIDSIKGALRPSLLAMPIDKAILSRVLRELSEELQPSIKEKPIND